MTNFEEELDALVGRILSESNCSVKGKEKLVTRVTESIIILIQSTYF